MKNANDYAVVYSVEGDAEELILDIEHNDTAMEAVAVVLGMEERLSNAEWRRLKQELIEHARKYA